MSKSRTHSSGPTLSAFDRIVLYLTVSLTGASVMVLELLGTRLIGPFYGVSLYVWSSLISVTMIALAFGYWLGGRIADRMPRIRLSYLIALAALTTMIIPALTRPVLLLTDPMGLRAGAFFSAFLLFTLPLTLLAMTGPYVIKLAARQLANVGALSGSVYAVSTVGSVIGTIALGFYLLPVTGSRAVLYGLSVLLGMLALMLALYERRGNGQQFTIMSMALIFFACLGGAAFAYENNRTQPWGKSLTLLYESESVYGWVRVIDDETQKVRFMMSDASTISAADIDNVRQGLLTYQWVTQRLPLFRPAAKNALLIGLGGGHIADGLEKQGVKTDAIEIDPAVAEAALRFFDYRPSGDLIVGDARYEIRQLTKTYDLIIHDCFTGGSEPAHLMSIETLLELKAHLNPGGILAINFVGFTDSKRQRPAQLVYRTLGDAFAERRVYISEPGSEFNDFIFMASDEPIAIHIGQGNPKMLELLSQRRYAMAEGDLVVTDDFNPLENLQVSKAEAYRKVLLERVGMDVLLR